MEKYIQRLTSGRRKQGKKKKYIILLKYVKINLETDF